MEIITGCVDEYRRKMPKVFEIPFNSTNKYHISIHESAAEKGHRLCMKGICRDSSSRVSLFISESAGIFESTTSQFLSQLIFNNVRCTGANTGAL